jgi:hypothetical protein
MCTKPNVKTKAIVASAAALVGVLFLTALFTFHDRHHTPAFVVRHFKRNVWQETGSGTRDTFGITNNRTSACFCYPTGIEIFDGTNWKTFSQISFPATRGLNLEPHKGTFYTVDNAEWPTGRPLRLKMGVGWELKGLSGALHRLKMRFRYKSNVPLNPFDKNSKVFSWTIETSSDAFIEPIPQDK